MSIQQQIVLILVPSTGDVTQIREDLEQAGFRIVILRTHQEVAACQSLCGNSGVLRGLAGVIVWPRLNAHVSHEPAPAWAPPNLPQNISVPILDTVAYIDFFRIHFRGLILGIPGESLIEMEQVMKAAGCTITLPVDRPASESGKFMLEYFEKTDRMLQPLFDSLAHQNQTA